MENENSYIQYTAGDTQGYHRACQALLTKREADETSAHQNERLELIQEIRATDLERISERFTPQHDCTDGPAWPAPTGPISVEVLLDPPMREARSIAEPLAKVSPVQIADPGAMASLTMTYLKGGYIDLHDFAALKSIPPNPKPRATARFTRQFCRRLGGIFIRSYNSIFQDCLFARLLTHQLYMKQIVTHHPELESHQLESTYQLLLEASLYQPITQVTIGRAALVAHPSIHSSLVIEIANWYGRQKKTARHKHTSDAIRHVVRHLAGVNPVFWPPRQTRDVIHDALRQFRP